MRSKITCISFLFLFLTAYPVYGLYLAEGLKPKKVGQVDSHSLPLSNKNTQELQPLYKEGEVLVKLRKGVISTDAKIIASSGVMSVAEEFMFLSQKRGQAYLLLRSKEITTEEMIAILEKDPVVEVVSPNYIRKICETFPDDPKFELLWGLHNTAQTCGTPDADIDAPEAWDMSTGSSDVVVAVIDTGVDYTHEDLAANMWINDAEATGTPSVDDDGNGYVDDIYGYDFASTNSGSNDSDPMDIHGHGTHVSGTISAVGNNGIGVVGVNWDAQIMALKGMRPDERLYDSDIIEAIEYIVHMKTNYSVNVVAINASYGGYGYSGLAKDAIEFAGDAGIVFVAAAGNDSTNNDVIPLYPCAYDSTNIICVAATDQDDYLTDFSNYGVTSVDLGAPGINIQSTVPFGKDTEASVTVDSTTYQAMGMEYAGQTDENGITGLVYDCGLGYPEDFLPEVSGNIALIERGELYFAEKTINAQIAGAVAVIIYNNEPCNFKGTLMNPGDWSPVVSISQEDGQDLINNQGGLPRTVTLINKLSNYGTMSGTSMATPHVTGAVALMTAEYPGENLNQSIDRILSGVDVIPHLEGKVKTEGKLNLANSINGGTSCKENDSGALDIKAARGKSGSQVTHTVRIQDAPDMVSSLGFEVTYDSTILQYADIFILGDCVSDFDYFDCYEPSPGVVRCEGSVVEQNIIPQGASCDVVDIQFDVIVDTCEPGNCPGTLSLQNLVDDVEGWLTSNGCFCCGCASDVDCDDGLFCNGAEICVEGECQPGYNPCPDDDGLFCNGEEGCDEAKDECVSSGDPCPDDGLFCNGEEGCDEAKDECVSSGDPCPEGTTCVEEANECRPPCECSIAPENVGLISKQPLRFIINTTGDCSEPDYEWSVASAIGSVIDQNGNYVAGINHDLFNETTDVVVVVDQANGLTALATVTVSWGCSLAQIYGENSEEVEALRSFRDNVLSHTPEGQEIIRLYYVWSPVIAEAMERDEEFKEELKELIDGILPLIRVEVE